MRYTIVLLLWMIDAFCATSLKAQSDKGFEMMELAKIAEVYRQLPSLSFDITYSLADSAQPNVPIESINGSSKVSYGMYWTMLDSVEYMQGNQYNVTVYYKDSTIVLNDKKETTDQLKIPVLDSIFRDANVDSLGITEVDSVTRMLTIYFKPGSSYGKYQIQYDRNVYLIRQTSYYLRGDSDLPSGTGIVSVTLTNYLLNAIPNDYFREDKFVYKQNGTYVVQPAYNGFILQNYLTTQPINQ